jgi:hypothetical protein
MRGTSSIANVVIFRSRSRRQLGFLVRVDERNQDRAVLHRLRDGVVWLAEPTARCPRRAHLDRVELQLNVLVRRISQFDEARSGLQMDLRTDLASLSRLRNHRDPPLVRRVSLSTAILTGMNAPPNKGAIVDAVPLGNTRMLRRCNFSHAAGDDACAFAYPLVAHLAVTSAAQAVHRSRCAAGAFGVATLWHKVGSRRGWPCRW